MARAYPVHEARRKLTEILRQVKQGRSVTISERGREIARVIPIDTPVELENRIEHLRRQGVILPATESRDAIRPIVRRPGALRRFLASR